MSPGCARSRTNAAAARLSRSIAISRHVESVSAAKYDGANRVSGNQQQQRHISRRRAEQCEPARRHQHHHRQHLKVVPREESHPRAHPDDDSTSQPTHRTPAARGPQKPPRRDHRRRVESRPIYACAQRRCAAAPRRTCCRRTAVPIARPLPNTRRARPTPPSHPTAAALTRSEPRRHPRNPGGIPQHASRRHQRALRTHPERHARQRAAPERPLAIRHPHRRQVRRQHHAVRRDRNHRRREIEVRKNPSSPAAHWPSRSDHKIAREPVRDPARQQRIERAHEPQRPAVARAGEQVE